MTEIAPCVIAALTGIPWIYMGIGCFVGWCIGFALSSLVLRYRNATTDFPELTFGGQP
jgi:hypothetical protein